MSDNATKPVKLEQQIRDARHAAAELALEADALAEAGDASVAPMSSPNRLIAYSAAAKLRELGYVWSGKEWSKPVDG